MEAIRFIFSDFWVWLGVAVLVGLILQKIIELVKACKQGRKVSTYKVGDVYRVEIENATSRDAEKAMENGRLSGGIPGGADDGKEEKTSHAM